jgi:hypothetical protein
MSEIKINGQDLNIGWSAIKGVGISKGDFATTIADNFNVDSEMASYFSHTMDTNYNNTLSVSEITAVAGNDSNITTADLVNHLYEETLGRPADAEGLEYWTNEIDEGRFTFEQLQQELLNSDEFSDTLNSIMVSSPYVPLLREDEVSYLQGLIENGLTNMEDLALRSINQNTDLFPAGRVGLTEINILDNLDVLGIDYSEGIDKEALINNIESHPNYGQLTVDDLTEIVVATEVNDLYQETLGRPADAEGLGYWTNDIISGVSSFDSLRELLITSEESQSNIHRLFDGGPQPYLVLPQGEVGRVVQSMRDGASIQDIALSAIQGTSDVSPNWPGLGLNESNIFNILDILGIEYDEDLDPSTLASEIERHPNRNELTVSDIADIVNQH